MNQDIKNIIGGCFFLALSIIYGILASSISLFVVGSSQLFTARTIPLALSTIGTVCSFFLILPSFIRILRTRFTYSHPIKKQEHSNLISLGKSVAFFLLLMTAYALLFQILGFIIASTGLIYAGTRILGERKIIQPLMISFGIVMGFWLLISLFLDIYLPSGWIWGI